MEAGKAWQYSNREHKKMSKKNRKKEYDKLVAINGLDRDDGALVKEFGNPEVKGEVDISYSDMTVAQLKSHCDKAELEYTAKATKDDLVVLLENKSDEK